MRHAFVRPVRHREYDDALGVDRVRVIGYRAASSDGYTGPLRATYAEAQTDAWRRNELARANTSPAP